ncbi:unnamed protein product [Sphagnum troendelagicum]|uniref:Uncharacterized protein n=1 Tax=Sphagnum troendelagicum TaxID=128251 RepID=A0ABP0UL14_9BRYO
MSFRERRDQAVVLEELKEAILSHGIGYQHPWDELREGKNVLDVACESAMDLMGTREREDLVRRGLQGVYEIGGAHQDQSTVISRGWLLSSSSSSISGSYLKPQSNNRHMTIYTPIDLLTGTNRLQGEIQELDPSPQHQDKPVVGARGEGDYRKQKKSEAKLRDDAESEAVNKRKRAELVAAKKNQAEFEAANRKQAEDEAHIRKQVGLQTGNGKGKNLTLGSKLNWRLNGGSRLRMKLQIGEDRLRRRRLRARKWLRKKQLIFTRSKRLS